MVQRCGQQISYFGRRYSLCNNRDSKKSMILIIPAMELVKGGCTRQTEGQKSSTPYYEQLSSKPSELARLWRTENAKTLHITDRDGIDGLDNSLNCEVIRDIVNSVDIPVQLYSHFPSVSSCIDWLEKGVFRLVLTTLVLDDPDGVEQLVHEYTSSRIVLGIRADEGMVHFRGDYPAIPDTTFALMGRELGITRAIYSDSSWEGTYFGPDPDTLRRIAETTHLRITASGGIDSPEELWMLEELASHNIDSVVVGRALFENRFPCQQIWRSIEAELAQKT